MQDNSFEDFKRELKQKNDIVSIISKYVQVERRGRYFWCRCPFHGEKTPSLCINDIDNTFYCFGCHVGGDVIKFVMQMESMSFVDAIKHLAANANMEVPDSFERNNGEDIAMAKKRKDRLIALMREAAKHYHDNLAKKTAEPARAYMSKRQLENNIATRFGIGYADGFYELLDYLKGLGFNEDEMLAVGVAKKKDNKIYDPLANRLIFPIIDIYGNVIAFGGRTLDPHPDFAKYLNTAETELFNKRNTLYAINYLKKQRQKGPIPYVIVVEGYMDTIALHKAGFTMAVASMGTALTQTQAKLIKRFSNKVYICYDGDSAGQNATLRGLDILKENDLDVIVVQLPDRFDPDDVIKTYGATGYQKILDEALPLIEFKLKFLKSKYDLASVDGRVKYLNDAIYILSSIKNSVERELYIPMVCEIAMTNADFVRNELDKKLAGVDVEPEIKSRMNSTLKPNIKTSQQVVDEPDSVVVKAEKYILFAMIHSKPYAHFKTDITYLFSGNRREIYNVISSKIDKDLNLSLTEKVLEEYEDGDQSAIADIINYGAVSAEDEQNEKRYFNDCVWIVYKNYLEQSLKDIMDEYSFEVNNERRNELSEKMKEITFKIRNKKVDEL